MKLYAIKNEQVNIKVLKLIITCWEDIFRTIKDAK